MGTLQLILAFHNHQPVGNFENVFREAFEKCYDPFVRFLEERPELRVSLHYSGCLFDWLEAREKQFLKRLARLVRRNQVEILGGGYYEPILPLIPENDAVGQLQYMNQYLKKRFSKTPSGFWLTERVWEQKIPRLSAQAGLRYTAVDDVHFTLAGLDESEIRNFFITEEEGFPLYLFPIPQSLRYLIPFREPGETLECLRRLSENVEGPAVVTYADDGEKLGLWPGTYQWVFREGWLARFADALEENRSWITLKTFSEVLEEWKGRPVKKVYLPTASYEEMGEWAMNPAKSREFSLFKRDLESGGSWHRARVFFQGGTFKNFLAKYSEADWMRSRMKWASERVQKLKGTAQEKARRELWQAQCNCPYWHGVFGGLYLHHLRRSTYEHLIRAEKIARTEKSRSPQLISKDLNEDGVEELVVETPDLSFYFQPHRGGSIAEIDYKPDCLNLLDTVTRREEAYHRELVERKGGGEGRGKSIHEIEKPVSEDVLKRLAFDPYDRLSFVEKFLPSDATLNDFWKAQTQPGEEPPQKVRYQGTWKLIKGLGQMSLKAQAPMGPASALCALEKVVRIPGSGTGFTVTWKVTNLSSEAIVGLWGSEWNFTFYDREREEAEVRQTEIQDGWSPVHLRIDSDTPFDYWQFPIETVAQTEKDFRLIHQGISVFPHWRLELAPRRSFERNLTFSFSSSR